MYDGIFEDFEIIKRHCNSNGNDQFEQEAVFELLEEYASQHGPARAVQMILHLLDEQTVRDCKIVKSEVIQTDDSNDSVIEVKVPKKSHPIIDLTDDSIQLNETLVIDKETSINGNIPKSYSRRNVEIDSNSNSNDENYFGCQTDNELSDSDTPKHFDDYWNPRKYNGEPLISEILAFVDDSNQSNNHYETNQINSNIPDVSEMLEENNNDPNNNLDGTVFEEELLDVNNGNNTEQLSLVNNAAENLNTNILGVIDPIPGCSKDTEEITYIRLNSSQSLPNEKEVKIQPLSPVAGCSKDFDNSNSDLQHAKHDESIMDDAYCIQNLLHWANWKTILTILEKYQDSPNRKQLALWDLMNENSDNKRKQDSDLYTVPKKAMKMDVDADDNHEDLLDLSTNSLNPFDSFAFNESNDSVSNSELISDTIKQNQNSNVLLASDSSNELHFNKIDDKRKLTDVPQQIAINEYHEDQLNNTKTQTFSKKELNIYFPKNQPTDFSKFVNFVDPVVKKERVETVVSGVLNEQSTIPAEETKSKEINNITNPNMLTNGDKLSHCSDHFAIKYGLIQIPMEKSRKSHNKEILEEMGTEKLNCIKPAKLNITQNPLPVYDTVRFVKRVPCIRPPNYQLNNAVHEMSYKTNERKIPVINAEVDRKIFAHNLHEQNRPSTSNTKANIERLKMLQLKVNQFDRSQKYGPYATPVIRSNVIKLQPPKLIIAGNPTKALLSETPPSVPKIVNSAPVALPTDPENYDRSIYNKLRSIFPGVKSSYIKKICKRPPVVIDMNNKSQVTSILIDHLLEEGNNHMQPVNVEDIEPKAKTVLSIDEQYEYLLGVFPDADPTFLRKFVEEHINEENVFEEFIAEKLETRNYPTKEQYLAKIKITEQIKQYTTDFNVEKFLEMFPDPFKHFEDEKRVCVHQPIAMEFLKSHFHKNKITTICRYYTINKYNLSRTAKALTTLGYDMKSKRMSAEMPTENIPLIQEMAFVKHKQSIISHINSRKAAEEKLFKELQEKNLLLTCQCCFNEECMPTKCAECNNNHVFCYDCLITGTEVALAKGDAHVKCFTDCQSDFSIATLQKVLSPTTFSALLKKRQAAEIIAAEVEGLVSCPFCHFASIPPPEDKVFKCLNPECMKETCRLCKELNHVPLKCDEVIKTDKARLLIEEKMTEALLRTCYNCKRQFYKEDGCNKMTCSCGALMCYLCNKPIKGYAHFNAQGGVNTHLCPLWSDDKRLNAEAVRKVAEDYKKAIMKENPNLKIDTELLLPKLPPRSKGPHDDIPNANQLPDYIRRVIAGP